MGDEGSDDPTLLKRARTGDLKRVAEIVMVLSAMGEMRGGKDPTAAEKALVAEAREKLTEICEKEFKPKDLIPKEAVRVLVEDLGLNRSRDPMMGFRPSKMSIGERLLHTKRKMEESKTIACSSQHPLGESHGTLTHGSSSKSPMVFSAGGFRSVSPGVHVSATNSITSSLKQSHVSDSQLTTTALKSSTSHLEKDSPLLSQPHAVTHLRFDGRPNGPPYIAQLQATTERTLSNSSSQSTSTIFMKPGQPNNFLDHTHSKSAGSHAVGNVQAFGQAVRNQGTKTSEVPSSVANQPIGHQPAQGVMFATGPSFFSNHDDISKSVQKILQPKVFDHPNLNPPSAEYTNQPTNCQVCKITITDVESLLICDACEKGTHLNCLQSYGNKEGVPKADWHCQRCLITSNGKPFPPKYGKVTRTIAPQKAPSNTAVTSASSEKTTQNLASKVNPQKPVVNGNSSLSHLSQASSSATNSNDLTRDSKTACAADTQPGMKKDANLSSITSVSNSTEQAAVVCAASSSEPESSNKDIKSNGSLTCNMERSTPESTLDQKVESERSCPENPPDTVSLTADQSEAPTKSKEIGSPINMEVFANQQQEIISLDCDESKEQPKLQRESQDKTGSDVRLDDRDNCQAAPSGKPNISEAKQLELKFESNNTLLHSQEKSELTPNEAVNNDNEPVACNKHSVPDSDVVHWLGDALQDIDGKTYYQSCQINGVSYKLQNYVLVSSSSQNPVPSKLQCLWEDNATGSKSAVVCQYYFPCHLPEVASCPSTPENNERRCQNDLSLHEVRRFL
ncbi:uncharacterized protein LOC109840118 isoform X2 [Asparagus officinalis]|uniref:uncharacterized protein LOC109840118 isoform X2 n=1 Tax=Asparagus officinalis TaxID=4686 RepID=UPI00098E40EF|nr:uncharacterized protein LOC109840118 isoform X2 [Asparagus officinalis]